MTLRVCLRWCVLILVSVFPRLALAQAVPAAGSTPPADTPSIRVGATIYTDYTFQQSPESTDLDGNTINASSFTVTRRYIKITESPSHIVPFRMSTDGSP